MSASAKTSSKRKHVTTACLQCRKSKVKCDGLTPSCQNCLSKGCECRYQMGDDRRKLSSRVAVELLCRRTAQLYRFIEDQGLHIPEMPEDDEAILQRVLNTIGIPIEHLTSDQHRSSSNAKVTHESPKEAQITTIGPLTGSNLEKMPANATIGNAQTVPDSTQMSPAMGNLNDQNWEPVDMETLNEGNPCPPHIDVATQERFQCGSPPSGSIDKALQEKTMSSDNDTGENESVEELVELLSDRMGSLQIGVDGQIRYYGPTSTFGLLNMSSTDPLHIHRSVRNDGQEYLDRFNVGAEIPSELENHLMNLYFTWQDASFHIVDREMYSLGKRDWHENMLDTPYYSESLRNAICSLGAAFETKYHPSFVTFPKSLGDFFADRAKMLLDIEMDSPTLATAQAMVVASCHDMGCTRDARAWLYSGMAIRLAFDLGLHKDMSSYVEKGIITNSEADLRRTIFWGAYLVDQAWAFHLGRQFNIGMENVSCDKPGADLGMTDPSQWTPYQSPQRTQSPTAGYINEVSRHRVILCQIMAPLGQYLYGGSELVPQTMQHINAASVEQLLKWKADLPVELHVDPDDRCAQYLPHVLLMHMHYYQCMIHAHRPWMSKSYLQPSPPQGPGSEHARQICVYAAISIAQLLEGYESRYSFRRINTQGPMITLSAALLLVFADITQYGQSRGLETARYLTVCLRALEEFGHCWESAKRARELLLKLQRDWDLKARMKRKARRGTGLTKAISNTSVLRKRPLTATDFDASRHDPSPPWMHSSHPSHSLEQQQGLRQSIDDIVGTDFDIDLNWIMGANESAVSGNWAAAQPSGSMPLDLFGFFGDRPSL